ncbi:SipW-dependent-type signal peptide-containing protein [Sutcliffiella rhizosphaerae]|uniref:Uncharacterized protein n=1 Tax=Sutcliffiella rhizosphaerae TaxID=2880967 RepID=A0ABN8A7Z4_9BACI|nr:SipW-dependent-type signal peptide-containing protein [Sutcliffiella rhizosphaerae]CAG9620764.1 hypothetical protein BACCIP111883_01534 [Sutcliffiella rhizosphaerae]
MANINKVKKAVMGTALAGVLVAGVGFGTYSWFTDSTEATGQVRNAVVEIVGGGQASFDYSSGYLAPSRSQIAEEWKTITNNSTERQISLNANFTGKLFGDSSDINFSQYKSTVLFVFNRDAGGVQDADFIHTSLREYLEEDDMSQLEFEKMMQRFYGAKMEIIVIDGEEDVKTLETTLENSGDTPVAAIVSAEYIEAQLEQSSTQSVSALSHDPVKVMEKGILFGEIINRQHYVHVLFGTSLKQTAGNEYQNAKLDFSIDVEANQLDKRTN